MNVKKTSVALASAAAIGTGIFAAPAQAGDMWTSQAYPTQGACNNDRIAYQHSGDWSSVSGCFWWDDGWYFNYTAR